MKSFFILVGIIISGIIYLVSNIVGLRLLALIMRGFFAAILLAIIIIFQEEIRRIFEKIALFSLSPKIRKTKIDERLQSQVGVLADTVFFFAQKRIGAILVLKGEETLLRNVQRGVALNGRVSASLLKSILDPNSDGHDGAVLIDNDRILQFACHLPLSKDLHQLQGRGTRHAAGLGLSEVTDALCVVVSETTGEISICKNGKISPAGERKAFQETIERFYKGLRGGQKLRPRGHFLMANLKEKSVAVLLSVCLWWFFVHESIVVYKSFEVPLQHISLSKEFIVTGVTPEEVKVVLSAPRRNFYFVNKRDIGVLAKIIDIQDLVKAPDGYYELTITASDVTLPGSFTIVNIFPRVVRVSVK